MGIVNENPFNFVLRAGLRAAIKRGRECTQYESIATRFNGQRMREF